MIIPASWIFALTMEMPDFLSLDFDRRLSSCTLALSKEWMGKAYSVVWFLVFGGLPIPLMAVLYSAVIYNLWFKRNHQSTLTYQQKVQSNWGLALIEKNLCMFSRHKMWSQLLFFSWRARSSFQQRLEFFFCVYEAHIWQQSFVSQDHAIERNFKHTTWITNSGTRELTLKCKL